MHKDILFEILIHCDSLTLKNVNLVNTITHSIVHNKVFWITKFEYYFIPKIDLTYDGFREYEKSFQIARGILFLLNHIGCKKFCALFNIDKTLKHLDTQSQNTINNYILKYHFTGNRIGLESLDNEMKN